MNEIDNPSPIEKALARIASYRHELDEKLMAIQAAPTVLSTVDALGVDATIDDLTTAIMSDGIHGAQAKLVALAGCPAPSPASAQHFERSAASGAVIDADFHEVDPEETADG